MSFEENIPFSSKLFTNKGVHPDSGIVEDITATLKYINQEWTSIPKSIKKIQTELWQNLTIEQYTDLLSLETKAFIVETFWKDWIQGDLHIHFTKDSNKFNNNSLVNSIIYYTNLLDWKESVHHINFKSIVTLSKILQELERKHYLWLWLNIDTAQAQEEELPYITGIKVYWDMNYCALRKRQHNN